MSRSPTSSSTSIKLCRGAVKQRVHSKGQVQLLGVQAVKAGLQGRVGVYICQLGSLFGFGDPLATLAILAPLGLPLPCPPCRNPIAEMTSYAVQVQGPANKQKQDASLLLHMPATLLMHQFMKCFQHQGQGQQTHMQTTNLTAALAEHARHKEGSVSRGQLLVSAPGPDFLTAAAGKPARSCPTTC